MSININNSKRDPDYYHKKAEECRAIAEQEIANLNEEMKVVAERLRMARIKYIEAMERTRKIIQIRHEANDPRLWIDLPQEDEG